METFSIKYKYTRIADNYYSWLCRNCSQRIDFCPGVTGKKKKKFPVVKWV